MLHRTSRGPSFTYDYTGRLFQVSCRRPLSGFPTVPNTPVYPGMRLGAVTPLGTVKRL